MTQSSAYREWFLRATDFSTLDEVAPLPEVPRDDFMSVRQKAVVCGIYVLLAGETVQYVGQSRNIYSRIAQHMACAPFEFDNFAVHECADIYLGVEEARLIDSLQPKWNKEIPAHGGKPHRRQLQHVAKT